MDSSTPRPATHRTRRTLIVLLKFGVTAAILAFAVYEVQRKDYSEQQFNFGTFLRRPKDWPALAAAWALCMTAVVLTFIRWYLLVRALQLPFRVRDSLRLGFLGYLFNLVSLGSVGGDLFKAVFIAREHPGRRTEAVATVVVDRMVGLYALFLVAGAAVLLVDDPRIAAIRHWALIGSAVGCVGMTVILLPGFSDGRLAEVLGKLPRVGPTLAKIFAAVTMYRQRIGTLLFTLVMSLGTHALYALGVYMIATGVAQPQTATLAEHFVIVPIGWFAQALPLPLGALGAFELAMGELYFFVPKTGMPMAEGIWIALVYRVVTIIIAAVGIIFYLRNRREVSDVWKDAEEEKA